MAAGTDCETGEPRLDNETGEERECSIMGFPALVRSREARTIQVTVSTNAETGENEWCTAAGSLEVLHRSPAFHIPQSLLHSNFTEAKLLVHILCALPMLIFFPAFTIALCMFTELCVHFWYHKWERSQQKPTSATTSLNGPYSCHLTPLSVVISAFCTQCQTKRVLTNFVKQAERYKMQLKNNNLLALNT